MKGDFSRLTFDATKHFSRVLMQQGRVQLDSDWNEQTAILLHYLQTLAADLIGPYAGPKDNFGLTIKKIDNVSDDFHIGNGCYYVDGILVESDAAIVPSEIVQPNNGGMINKIQVPVLTINNKILKEGQYLQVADVLVKITKIDTDKSVLTVEPEFANPEVFRVQQVITYKTQNDYPLPIGENIESNKAYLVYIDLWERHVTYIEDDSIREVALGGSDTTTRARIVWQIKVENKTSDDKAIPNNLPEGQNWFSWIEQQWPAWKSQWQPINRGMLKARAMQDQKNDTDPCITSPKASYRGVENQLYRVEIHQGGKVTDGNNPTFKWSRDNGSVVVNIVTISGVELTVDDHRGLSVGQWLELINNEQELRGEAGTMVKINKIDCDIVTLADIPTPKSALPTGEAWPTKARLWNSDQITIKESNSEADWLPLEDGVQIQFQPSEAPHQYRTGDYWLIPARVANGDVEWPGETGKPEALPPQGVEHHYAPLAIISMEEGNLNFKQDLRQKIAPLGVPVP